MQSRRDRNARKVQNACMTWRAHKTGSAQHCKHVLFLERYFLNYNHLLIFSKDFFNGSV